MKSQGSDHRSSAMRGYISAQAALVLAVITAATGVLAYEWHSAHSAHSAKGHHDSAEKQRHPKTHDAKSATNN